jgi:hypothetical protein
VENRNSRRIDIKLDNVRSTVECRSHRRQRVLPSTLLLACHPFGSAILHIEPFSLESFHETAMRK